MDRSAPAAALLVEDGFEDQECTGISEALSAAGIVVVPVGPVAGRTYAGRHGARLTPAVAAREAAGRRFAAIVIPGGGAPDRIRMRHGLLDLVRDAVADGRTVAAMGHGPQVLISAAVVRGRTLTCWPSIAVDVKNAGGLYVDRPVAEDGPIVTARKAADIRPFVEAILRRLGSAG